MTARPTLRAFPLFVATVTRRWFVGYAPRSGNRSYEILSNDLNRHFCVIVQLEDLTLYFDRSQQHPDLIGSELDRAAVTKLIEFFRDRSMLVRRRLESKARVSPDADKVRLVLQLRRIVNLIQNQQTESCDVTLGELWLEARYS